jgi:hypothetical protein
MVDPAAIPEPYLGSWNQAQAAVLDLHPGKVFPRFQHRRGLFDREIGEMGSYAAWAASWPYVRTPWTDDLPPVRHITSRLRFLQDWFDEPELSYDAMLGVELYPWHVTTATAPIRPDPGVVREFVLEPLADSDVREVFAFGTPWFAMLTDHLSLEVVARLGAGGRDYGSRVESRTVLVCAGRRRLRIVVEKHRGGVGPPATDETLRLRNEIERL